MGFELLPQIVPFCPLLSVCFDSEVRLPVLSVGPQLLPCATWIGRMIEVHRLCRPLATAPRIALMSAARDFSCMFWRFFKLIRTRALSLNLFLAKSTRTQVRILLTSHDRCWSVRSRPYLPCHLATCASARTAWPARYTTHRRSRVPTL